VVRERLTAERLGPYLSAADQDLGAAFRLYEWNIAAAASVLATIAMTEVVVRNAMDTELRRWAVARRGGRSWLDAAPLDTQGRDDVSAARRYAHRTNRTGGPVPHGKVVAELNLGFWRYLAASRYLTDLWIPALHGAFPAGPAQHRRRRAAVEDRLQRLLTVRNRAAHHEPIFRRDLHRDLTSAIEVVTWICPDSAAWIEARSTVNTVMDDKPPLSPL
jgi:hypothetical protein